MESIIEVIPPKKVDIIYFVKEGEDINQVANKFKISVDMIRQDNDLQDVCEGDILWIRQRNSFVHIVCPLDTLISVATKYKVTTQHIKEVNNLTCESLYIGQKLII